MHFLPQKTVIFYLRQLKNAKLAQKLLVLYLLLCHKSLMTYGLSVWVISCTKKNIQRVMKNTTNIIRAQLPDIRPIYDFNCLCRLLSAIRDQSHPAHFHSCTVYINFYYIFSQYYFFLCMHNIWSKLFCCFYDNYKNKYTYQLNNLLK